MKHLYSVFFFFVMCGSLFAQGAWKWPENKALAQEKKVLYTDYMEHGDYLSALEPLEWLIAEAPDLNYSLYVHGATLYRKLAETAEEPTEQAAYKKRALEMFDLRVKHFGGEKNVLNRKALIAYRFYKKEPEQYPLLLQFFKEAISLNQAEITSSNLLAYMDILQREKKLHKTITEDDIISAYMEIKDILAAQAENDPSPRFQKIVDGIDKIFVGSVRIDCPFVHEKWAPQLVQNDPQVAKYVVNFLLIADCTEAKDDSLFLEAGQIYYESEPTLAMAKALAKRSMQLKEYTMAVSYYKKAIGHIPAENAEGLAGIHMGLAKAYTGLNRKVKARQFALLAAKVPETAQGAYNLMGGLYLSSYQDCRKGVSKVEDKAIYILAYEMYQKAQNKKKMAECQQRFPTVEDMFELGKAEGEVVRISCWFNEEVTLRRASTP